MRTGCAGGTGCAGADGLREFAFAKAIARQRFKPPLNLTSFGRTEKADQQLVSLLTVLHGRASTIPKAAGAARAARAERSRTRRTR